MPDVLIGADDGNVHLYQGIGLRGDLDDDGDVDLNDFATFAACYYGSAITVPPPSCTLEQFTASDLDEDGDVDLSDFSTFALNFTG